MFGKKIYLSELQENQIEQLRQWRNRSDIKENTRIYHDITSKEQQNWYHKYVKNNYEAYHFAIHENETDKFVGYCSLTHLNKHAKHAEFSIYLGDLNSYGKGYGSDALRCLLKYGFTVLDLNRIWGEVFSNNPAALRLYLHLGFEQEGKLRQHHYSQKDGLVDVIIVGLLRENYDK